MDVLCADLFTLERWVSVIGVNNFVIVLVFFFFKQKTAYEMRISDWSSDVCSSDLNGRIAVILPAGSMWARNVQLSELDIGTFITKMFQKKLKIGRASCRERVCQYV